MKTHDYEKYAESYAKLGITGTYYLAFRDIPLLLKKYCPSAEKVLDYGCGTGRSLRFIRELGYKEIVGVDINKDMIEQAKKIDPSGIYKLIENDKIPFQNKSFDLIFMSYVFLEVADINEIIKILEEFKRVLKDNGCVIFVTSIVKDIRDKWLSFSYDFKENDKPLDKCQNLKLLIKDKNIVLHDYNWTLEEYEYAIKQTGFKIETIHTPIGTKNDPYKWLDEKNKPYKHIFVLRPKK